MRAQTATSQSAVEKNFVTEKTYQRNKRYLDFTHFNRQENNDSIQRRKPFPPT